MPVSPQQAYLAGDSGAAPGRPSAPATALREGAGTGWVVLVSYPDGRSRRVPLPDRPLLVVGRAGEADVCLDDPSVSRRHAELSRSHGWWAIRDLGSRNGTRVGGRPVDGDAATPFGQASTVEVGGVALTLLPLACDLPPARPGSLGGARAVPLRDDAVSTVVGLAEMPPPTVAAAHLTTLLDLGRDLLEIPDPGDRLCALCEHMVGPAFGGRYVAVLRVSPDRPDVATPLCEAGAAGSYVSRTAVRAAADRGEAVLAGNRGVGGGADGLAVSISAAVLPVAVIACPLSAGGIPAGPPAAADLLYVALPPEYGTGEWLALAGLAVRQHQQAESAWAARRQAEAHAGFERELVRAREIQRRLVPRGDLVIAGVDVAVGFEPCRAVGGDYVDVVPLADGRVLLAVADVCGKGLPAALVTAALHTMVRASTAAGLGLAALMANLNRHLCQTLPGDAFVTMFAAVLDPATGQLECVNAGHPPPFVVPAGGGAAWPLDVESALPLGLDSDPLPCDRRTLGPGDAIGLYTDGLSELGDPGGTMLGVAGVGRLIEAAWRPAGTTAAAAAAALTRHLDDLQDGRPPADDRTFLLARLSVPQMEHSS